MPPSAAPTAGADPGTGDGAAAAANNNNNAAAGAGIPVSAVAMKLLDARLQGATALIGAVMGEFTAPGAAELCCMTAGGVLQLYQIVQTFVQDEEDDEEEEPVPVVRLQFLGRVETRSILRSAVAIRWTGSTRDMVAVGSDSGALSILEWNLADTDRGGGGGGNHGDKIAAVPTGTATCKIIHCVDFGKTSVRRAVPGQYIAADPAGRALCIAAVEKAKLVYVLNRNAAGEPTLASPLEAHRSRTLTVDMVGLDNGYDNPLFAVLELAYPHEDDEPSSHQIKNKAPVPLQKEVAYYELDLGLNHVIRRWASPVPITACRLAALPGGADGPGGVLVAAANGLVYVHETNVNHGNLIQCVLPRRKSHPPQKSVLLTQLIVHKQKRSKFFCLGQTELGDVYKITVQVQDGQVTGLTAAVLDTLPVANSLHVNKLGLLFCAAEFGAHTLYQFERIDIPDAPTNSSADTNMDDQDKESSSAYEWLASSAAIKAAATFDPSPTLQNLRRIVALDNPSPTTGVLVGELAGNETSPQVYALTGRGPCSALRILRHGAAVTELAISELPGVPGGIFTVQSANGKVDKYIVVSFADASLVLSVGETVEEVGKESGFLTNSPTLACTALGKDGALCQVHPAGVRHIKDGQPKQWNCPGLKRIEYASANEAQILIALAGGEVIYFELDPMNGNLTEASSRDLKADVCCVDVGRLPGTSSRSMWAAIGFRDHTVRIVSLQPGQLLVQKSSTATQSRPHSVALIHGKSANDPWTLVIGLDDGSSLRTTVDPVTGAISTSVTRRFLGVRPVAVSRMRLDGQSAMMLLSSRSWVGTTQKYAPLSYLPLDHATSFSSPAVPEGLVATAGKTLRILSIDTASLGSRGDDEAFHAQHVGLRYTPRQMTLLAGERQSVVLAVVESDYNDYGYADKKAKGFDPDTGKTSKKTETDDAMDVDSDDEGDKAKKEEAEDEEEEDEEEKEARRTVVRGPVPPSEGHWGSCVRIMNPAEHCKTLDCIELGRNEAALCCCSVRFHSKGGEPLLAVGTVTDMTLHPLKQTSSNVLLYRVVGGERLQLLHRTTVNDGPILAMAHFQGRLLVGIGKSLRLYEMGKRQLLRKCELKGLPTFCKTLQTAGDRAFVGDMMTSIQIVRYDASANRLALIANDPTPRPIVCQELLDWNTVAVGDKFGNVSILRLPTGADTNAVDFTGQRALWDSTRADITPRMELLCQYYVGEVVTSMTRSALVAGGPESIIYVTVTGRIGALIPFASRDDVDFYTQLEAALRTEAPRPTGRDPQAYRSYYAPVLHVIDGDLCSSFKSLPYDLQSKVADSLERTIGEISKKLEDTRNALL